MLDPRVRFLGAALECKLNVKVRDPEKRLSVKKMEIKPELLKAEFIEREDSAELGIYDLKIWVPADSPDAYYRGRNAGKIRMEFDHPRIEPLELGVEFFVDRLKD